MDFELKNKVAVVTGAASGFGAAIARALLAEGCIRLPCRYQSCGRPAAEVQYG